MNRGITCQCQGGSRHTHFDAEAAYERLRNKQLQIAEIITSYMGEAALDRTQRNRNAERFKKTLERIVGGHAVNEGDYPECCLVGGQHPNGSEEWSCTGVLIHPQVVLSAGHCHHPSSPANVVALNTEGFHDLADAEIIPVRRTVVHPDYLSTGTKDISVLILRHAATKVAPVEMASSRETNGAHEVTLVGFGNNDQQSTMGFGRKREVDVDIVSIRRTGSDDLDAEEHRYGFESDFEFVAGGDGYDSCNGDSGGPSYIFVDGERKVAGLTSRATDVATVPCGDGGVYTRVDNLNKFVTTTMRDAGIDPTRSEPCKTASKPKPKNKK